MKDSLLPLGCNLPERVARNPVLSGRLTSAARVAGDLRTKADITQTISWVLNQTDREGGRERGERERGGVRGERERSRH